MSKTLCECRCDVFGPRLRARDSSWGGTSTHLSYKAARLVDCEDLATVANSGLPQCRKQFGHSADPCLGLPEDAGCSGRVA